MALTKVQIDGVEFSDSTDLNVDNGTLFVDSTNNRVGVGTTSPAFSNGDGLEIQREGTACLRLDDNTNSKAGEIYADSTGLNIDGRGTGAVINFDIGGSTKATLDNSGRLGIGTSSPLQDLHVRGTTGVRIQNSTDTDGQFILTYTSNSPDFRMYDTSGNVQVKLLASGNSYINGGNLGIGTTSPNRPLHVSGSGSQAALVGSTDAGGALLVLDGDADGDATGGDYGYIRHNTDGDLDFTNLKTGVITFNGTSALEKARIDSSGRLLVGTSTSRSNWFNTTNADPLVQLEGSSSTRLSITRNDNTDNPGELVLGNSRSSAYAAVSNNDNLGRISFQGADGSEMVAGAYIQAFVDGTPGANDMPGRLVFYTTPDAGASPIERARIDKNGRLTVQYGGAVLRQHSRADNAHQFSHDVTSSDVIWLNVTTTSYAASAIRANVYRTNNSSYHFAQFTSGNLGDDEFIFKGDGNGFADGSFSGGGADYAEYFEWSDGNTGAEDRRGISVVLDGDKIREAVAGEEPIGVISGNPSVVGDAAWNKWNGKYLRDDFGTYIRNAEGERQLNPDYNPDVEYVSRENRPEWDCVGLMGKLRIRKGQVTGARWIKMRDVSDNVEEWLVR